MIKAVLFDMDGVITDTEKLYNKYWVESAHDLSYDFFTSQDALDLRSLNMPDTIALFKERYGENFDIVAVKNLCREKMKEEQEKNGVALKYGVREILEFLKEKNVKSAVATATFYDTAKSRLISAGVFDLFDRVISAHMVEHGKPYPDVYIYAASELGLKPKECIAVEDSPNGVLSAYRAGCKTVMVPDLTEPDEELKKLLFGYAKDLTGLKEFFL